MEKIKINIGGNNYTVEVAYTEDEREQGLSSRDSLDIDKGMLFAWDEPELVSMWMKDTKIPLDIIFIDNDLIVTAIYKGVPDSEEVMSEDNTSFVLELNQNSGINIGDELEFSPEKTAKKNIMTSLNSDGSLRSKMSEDNKMHVLNENGETQMELDGGERIFSRPHTKILIKFAKKAVSSNRDNDFKALGKRVFKFLKDQDERDPEYVE